MANKDIAHRQIDDRIDKLSIRLAAEYNAALIDLKRKLKIYLKDFKDADLVKREEWLNGKISYNEYKTWRQARMLTGKRYNALILELSNDLTNVNQVANNMIRDSLANTFMDAANYTAYEIETTVGANTINYALYNKDSVYDLIKDDVNLLPPPSSTQAKIITQKSIQWNMLKINSAITQGILQGESLGKVANRLQFVTDMNRSQALRNARTLHTQAENKGRLDRYEEAEKSGIELQKQWLATLDNRTRDAHRELDGEIRANDEPFENAIGKIMYPGDPNADPANVYNCRCHIRAVIKNHPYKSDRFTQKGYDEWKKGKKAYAKYIEEQEWETKYGEHKYGRL